MSDLIKILKKTSCLRKNFIILGIYNKNEKILERKWEKKGVEGALLQKGNRLTPPVKNQFRSLSELLTRQRVTFKKLFSLADLPSQKATQRFLSPQPLSAVPPELG